MRIPVEFVLVAVALGGVIGCASQRPTIYVDPGSVVSGTPDQATMYDLESSAQILMEKMLASPQFSANYNAAKTSKGRLPIAVIGNIENKSLLGGIRKTSAPETGGSLAA